MFSATADKEKQISPAEKKPKPGFSSSDGSMIF
jgi:hypothetical protein